MTTARFDYTSTGFITFDALCRPVTQIPPGVAPISWRN